MNGASYVPIQESILQFSVLFLKWYTLFNIRLWKNSFYWEGKRTATCSNKLKDHFTSSQNKRLDHNLEREERSSWINRDKASPREAFGLSIASGFLLDYPTFDTHVPTGIESIGSWRMGKQWEECSKCLYIPEN